MSNARAPQTLSASYSQVCVLLASLWIALGSGSTTKADDRAQPQRGSAFDRAADERLRYMLNLLNKYQVVDPEDDSVMPAKMSPMPLMRWATRQGSTFDGIIVAYARKPAERPVVLGHYQAHHDGKEFAEFSAVQRRPFELIRDADTRWMPAKRYGQFQDFAREVTPADQPAARLRQMQELAARFQIVDAFGWAEKDIVNHQLHIVSKPVHRYGGDGDTIDGAIFFAQLVTDPEAAIFIEAYRQDGKKKWRYRLCELSIYELTAKLDGQVVWKKPRELIFADATSSHYAGPVRPDAGEPTMKVLMAR